MIVSIVEPYRKPCHGMTIDGSLGGFNGLQGRNNAFGRNRIERLLETSR
jgi:hypothetical protein